MGDMRNIVRLKNIPSNIIDEAIIILKQNKKARKFQFSNSKDSIFGCKDDDDANYVVKEAELIINNCIEEQNLNKVDESKKIKKLKLINFLLIGIAIIGIIF